MDTADRQERRGNEELPRGRLRPPSVPALQRRRLLDAVVGAPQRLVLVTGPAGSGKTTLLMQLVEVAQRSRSVVWYQLDGGDARAPALLGHLAEALGPALPGLAGGWQTVEHAVADLEGLRRDDEVLLALDDLHVLAGTAAEDALERLLDLAPTWLQVAATCRQPPAWNLSRQRVSGALLEIGAEDLRFRSWEVERLFTELYGEPLPPGDIALLTRGLEGWAAGFQLFHLSTRGKPVTDRRRAVAALPARSKLIREYLTGNVLAELPEELRSFLIDTSVLGRLTPGLADELRGRDDSARLLAELASRQVFVDHVDEDDTYRYHEVFRTYLEGRLVERDGQKRARDQALRAAELLEVDGRMLEALRAYCRSEDWLSVGRVLEKAGAELVEDSVSWLDWLPRGLIEDDPWAMLAAARRAAATGRFTQALDLYNRAERLPGAAGAAEMCRQERAGLAGWFDPMAPPPRGWAGQILSALRSRPAGLMAVEPGKSAEGPQVGRALVAGIAATLTGDLRAATRWLSVPSEDPEADVGVVAAARLSLAVVRALGGVVDPGIDDLVELVEMAEVPWLTWMARAVRALDGTEEGWNNALETAEALELHGDGWGDAAARYYAVLGAIVAGRDPVEEIEDLCTRLRRIDAAVPLSWCMAWRATAMGRRAVSMAEGMDSFDRAFAAANEALDLAEQIEVPGAQVWATTVIAQLMLALEIDEMEDALDHAAELRRRWSIDVVVPPLELARPAAAPATATAPMAAASPAAAAPLVVTCLGGFALLLDGQAVELGGARPRARAALRMLAVHGGRPVHVETLIEALWPDGDPTTGKRNLQVAVSSLRRILDEQRAGAGALIVRDANAYMLALPDGAEADVVTFAEARDGCRTAAGGGDAAGVIAAGERALAAYSGELLPEEGPAEWVVHQRRNLALDAADVALLVAEHAGNLARWDTVVAACSRGLDVDRFNDALWRLLVAAHERRGDPAAAAQAQQRYRLVLHDLGMQEA